MVARAVGPVAAAGLWMLGESYQIVLMAVCGTAILFALAFWAASWVSRARAA